MRVTVVKSDSLPWSKIANEFIADDHDVSITCLIVEAAVGHGVALHKHPYDEVIVVLGGEATLDDGIETHAVRVGDIVVIPAGQPHGFTNTGESPLKQIDIHASPHFVTEWLDRRSA